MEQSKQRLRTLESRLELITIVAIALAVLLVCSSSWLGENVFSYEIQETKTVREPYEYVTGTISTYICYTTDYGDCYHARGCGSLWNSSHKTTVYEAERLGYEPCSKCTPSAKTVLELTETRYRDVRRTENVTKEPKYLVGLIGVGLIIAIYYVSTIGIKKEIKKLKDTLG